MVNSEGSMHEFKEAGNNTSAEDVNSPLLLELEQR